MGDGNAERRASAAEVQERIRDTFHAHVLVLADEVQRAIANQRAGKQARFAQDLESIADPEQELAGRGVLLHRLHDRRKPGDGPATQVIAIGKAAGQDDEIVTGDGSFLVPDIIGGDAKFSECEDTVLIAIGAWEADNGSFQ